MYLGQSSTQALAPPYCRGSREGITDKVCLGEDQRLNSYVRQYLVAQYTNSSRQAPLVLSKPQPGYPGWSAQCKALGDCTDTLVSPKFPQSMGTDW